MDRDEIFARISAERDWQDSKWGGADHDTQHSANDWIAYVVRQLGDASRAADRGDAAGYRQELIHAGALIVAALEAGNG